MNHLCFFLSVLSGKQKVNAKDELERYGSYHQSKSNRLTHALGIPLILFSLFCSLGWLRCSVMNISLTLGDLFYLIIFSFYFQIQRGLSLAFVAWSFPLFILSRVVSTMPLKASSFIVLGGFLLGWVFQLLGHSFEKNRPAFLKELSHLWRGPLFITHEFVALLGIKF